MIIALKMNSLWPSVCLMVVIVMCCCSTTQGTRCNEDLSGSGDSGYRGCQTVTRTGKRCQAWNSQYPHEHTRTPYNYPQFGLEGNFCRNPDGSSTIWCYTTDSGSRWEYCDPLPKVSMANDEELNCNEDLSGSGDSGYRGCQTLTRTGKTCQAWNSQYPHEHTRTPSNYPSFGLERNYCRNPDGSATIWCYTTDSGSRWEYCDSIDPKDSRCNNEALSGSGDSGYRGCQTVTRSGKTCQAWDSQSPHKHKVTPARYPHSGLVKNYCRNPDGEETIWCYTTDSRTRWELCDPLDPKGWRSVVANEDELVGSCTGTCDEIGYLDHQPAMLEKNCKVVKDCKLLSAGWTRGFVRCDYCKCSCEDSRAVVPEVIEVVTKKQFTESDLYDTCTGTCPKSGLVRTDWGGCKQVRNCRHSYDGWTRGFVRCDHCLCDCINHKYVNRYELRNVKYDTDQADIEQGEPTALNMLPVENNSGIKQTSSLTMDFSYTNSQSVTTATSISTGMEVTVEAGFDLELFEAGISTTYSVETGFSSEVGEVIEESRSNSVTATISVPPGQSCKVMVIANVMNLDVPYTADLVTIYSDNSESVTETEGVYSGVETRQFRVQYSECSGSIVGEPIFTEPTGPKIIKGRPTIGQIN